MSTVIRVTLIGLMSLAMAIADTRQPTAQQDVARIASMRSVHAALRWVQGHPRELMDWQYEVSRIPAPPFKEHKRADWARMKFEELGLQNVHVDGAGNVLGVRSGRSSAKSYVMISAHLDTVFPETAKIEIRRDGMRLLGPGVSDNGCGLTAMLGVAAALKDSGIQTELPILFVANVGEEGEGDLRGMRYLFNDSQWRDAITYSIVLDGGGTDSIIAEGLGSRRFEVIARGPGGHSWSDFGTPNPIVLLARVIDLFSRTSVPTTPKTTFNIGGISGGTSVNAIPEFASFKVDIRSASSAEMDRVEKALRSAVSTAITELRSRDAGEAAKPRISVEIKSIGNRPGAELKPGARLLQVMRAVDTQLGISSRVQRASTDGNIPLSLGLEAVTIGGGGVGGGAHTLHEWYDATNRELGLRRVLFAALTMAGAQE